MNWGIAFGFEPEAKGITAPLFRQVHGTSLVEITDEAARARQTEAPPEADGAYSWNRGLELHVFTADCMPLLFFGEGASSPVAAVHCGWRGARLGIAKRTLATVQKDSDPLHVILGPSIMGCCFEVKGDFVEAFQRDKRTIHPYLETRAGKTYCHLARFVIEQELAALRPDRIHLDYLECTYCAPRGWPSYRRNGGTDPRIRGWIRRG